MVVNCKQAPNHQLGAIREGFVKEVGSAGRNKNNYATATTNPGRSLLPRNT